MLDISSQMGAANFENLMLSSDERELLDTIDGRQNT